MSSPFNLEGFSNVEGVSVWEILESFVSELNLGHKRLGLRCKKEETNKILLIDS